MRSNLLAQLLGSALVVSVGEGDVVSAFGKGQAIADPIPPVPPLTKAVRTALTMPPDVCRFQT